MRQLLGFEKDIEVVAVYGSGIECLEQIDEYLPDVIFMDIRMPGISGIETTRLLCQKYPNIKVIMLTAHDEVQYVTDAISAGAKGYVLKKVRQEELIKIIHDVIDHSEPFYSRTDVFCVGCKAICKLRSEQQNYCLSNSLK